MHRAKGQLTFIEFQSPTLAEKAPDEGDWVHEIKYDGYRTQLVVEAGKAKAFTRRGYDWSHRYRRMSRPPRICRSNPPYSMAKLSFSAPPACLTFKLWSGSWAIRTPPS